MMICGFVKRHLHWFVSFIRHYTYVEKAFKFNEILRELISHQWSTTLLQKHETKTKEVSWKKSVNLFICDNLCVTSDYTLCRGNKNQTFNYRPNWKERHIHFICTLDIRLEYCIAYQILPPSQIIRSSFPFRSVPHNSFHFTFTIFGSGSHIPLTHFYSLFITILKIRARSK